ncbi:alpha/beta fold hydrolase [Gordonia sp. X0973]|uniref:alpha/beta fold hydrolase n=1 Tax=Gordonia sp. X0973 TaxID=2742602 RepID=UPI000F53A4E2|nr:alpha/beta fold hydrolase [Gordonia sp. X0973]QKT08482.1 alpha/beta fold hydrolase [Gordonia sp. X0973]
MTSSGTDGPGAVRHYLLTPELPASVDTLVVLDTEIGMPPQSWHFLVAELADRGLPCLVRVRPGYAWSPGRGGAPVDGALKPIVANAHRVVAVAHSFAGLLALRSAAGILVAERPADTLVLLDAVTPQMVSEVRQNRMALGNIRRSFGITTFSTALGLGPLSNLIHQPSRWYPPQVQRGYRRFRNDPRNALAAQREFNRVIADDAASAPFHPPAHTVLVHSELGLPNAEGYAAYQQQMARDLGLPESAIVAVAGVAQKRFLTSPSAISGLVETIQHGPAILGGRQ